MGLVSAGEGNWRKRGENNINLHSPDGVEEDARDARLEAVRHALPPREDTVYDVLAVLTRTLRLLEVAVHGHDGKALAYGTRNRRRGAKDTPCHVRDERRRALDNAPAKVTRLIPEAHGGLNEEVHNPVA